MAKTIKIGGGDREQVSDLDRPERLRPSANPRDTYVRPGEATIARPQSGDLSELVRGLEAFGAGVQNLGDTIVKKQSEEDLRAGIDARLRNQKAFKQAVDEGVIPAGASPWFIKGYQQQDGRLAGLDFDASLRKAWSNDPVRNSDDPKALGDFVAKHRESFLKDRMGDAKTHPDWLDGFAPALQSATNSLQQAHISHRQQEVHKSVLDNTYKETYALLGQESFRLQQEAGMDVDASEAATQEIGKIISSRLSGLVANGLSGHDANKMAVDAVVDYALAQRDRNALKTLEGITTGSGKLSGTQYAKDKAQAADKFLRDWDRSDDEWQWNQEGRPHILKMRSWAEEQIPHQREMQENARKNADRAQEGMAALSEANLQTLTNPTKPIDGKTLAKLEAIEPGLGERAIAYRRSLLQSKLDVAPNAAVITGIRRDMLNGIGKFDVNRIWAGPGDGTFDISMQGTLFGEYRTLLEKGANDTLMKDPILARNIHGLRESIEKNVERGVSGASYNDAVDAEMKLRLGFIAWQQKNPNATADEGYAAIAKMRQTIFEAMNPVGFSISKSAQDFQESQTAGQPKAPERSNAEQTRITTTIGQIRSLQAERKRIVDHNARLPMPLADTQGRLNILDRSIDDLRRSLQTPGAGDKPKPKPNAAAILELQTKPWLFEEFERTFGEGSADAHLKGGGK